MSDDAPPLLTGESGLKARGGLWGERLAEFLRTFVLITFGVGSVRRRSSRGPGD